jgi:hypothetical protein
VKYINPDLSVAEALRDALHVARLATAAQIQRNNPDIARAEALRIAERWTAQDLPWKR